MSRAVFHIDSCGAILKSTVLQGKSQAASAKPIKHNSSTKTQTERLQGNKNSGVQDGRIVLQLALPVVGDVLRNLRISEARSPRSGSSETLRWRARSELLEFQDADGRARLASDAHGQIAAAVPPPNRWIHAASQPDITEDEAVGRS